jgi:hypothetical protein
MLLNNVDRIPAVWDNDGNARFPLHLQLELSRFGVRMS